MFYVLKLYWREYLFDAWALGVFMLSASLFTILFEHPLSPVHRLGILPIIRRLFIGLAMGLTAVFLLSINLYGQSGPIMNPAVTLAQLYLGRIEFAKAIWHIIAQFAGGIGGVYILRVFIPSWISHSTVSYIVTVPGKQGVGIALLAESLMSFGLLTSVLFCEKSPYLAPYIPYIVGALLTLYITAEAPLSGMSINPARTVASALCANTWQHIWIYFVGPIGGMIASAMLFRFIYHSS